MRFEHIIQVNDILNPLVDPLTREALWAGLVGSIESPLRFLPGLDEARVLSREGDTWRRELRFGHSVIRDTVRFMPGEGFVVRSVPTPEVPALTRTVTIEEPLAGEYCVRFAYERHPEGHPPLDAAYARVVEQAWLAADIDLIAQIRREKAN
jgi:hypothetical protein